MLLAIDIGNTNIVLGVFERLESEEICFELRLTSSQERTEDEYLALISSSLERRFGSGAKFTAAIITSVVPPLTDIIWSVVKAGFGLESLIVEPGTKTGVSVKVDEPKAVGSDRIVNAVAVKTLYGSPALVVDFGTATTFDYVGADGSYEGGVIAPGLVLSLNALVQNTARLPRIELQWPERVIGKSTVKAMQSGTLLAYVCMVEGLIDRIIKEQGTLKHIVTTGGLGGALSQHSEMLKVYDPHLTLKGLKLIYQFNQ